MATADGAYSMSEEDHLVGFLVSPTVARKAALWDATEDLQSIHNPRALFHLLLGQTNIDGVDEIANWNAAIFQALSSSSSDDNRMDRMLELEAAGIASGLTTPPLALLVGLATDVFEAKRSWALAQRLDRGASELLSILVGWIKASAKVWSDPRLEAQAATTNLLSILEERFGQTDLVGQPMWAVQSNTLEPAHVHYARECSDVLKAHGETLAAAALLAGVAAELDESWHGLRWELNGLASQYLVEHHGHDLSRALLVKAGTEALYDEGGPHHEMAIGNLNSAIGECYSLLDDDEITPSPEFESFRSALHLDRGVWRLGADEGGYWLALEDYRVAIEIKERLLASETSEGSRRNLSDSLTLMLQMEIIAKRKSNVYSDRSINKNLNRIVALAEESRDQFILARALQQRATHFTHQSDELTDVAFSDLRRALNITNSEDDEIRSAILGNIASIMLERGNDIKLAAKYFSEAIEINNRLRLSEFRPSKEATYNTAKDWNNLAAARIFDPDYSMESALNAYRSSINICEEFLADSSSEEVDLILAATCMQMGAISSSLGTAKGWMEALQTATRAIELLLPKYQEERGRCSTVWIDDLASAYSNRSSVWAHRGSHYAENWRHDIEQAIEIRTHLLKSFGESVPLQSIERLCATLLRRAEMRSPSQSIADHATQSISDCEVVIQLLSQLEEDQKTERLVKKTLFSAYATKADALSKLGQADAALEAGVLADCILRDLPQDSWTTNHRFSFELAQAQRLTKSQRYENAIEVANRSLGERSALINRTTTRSGLQTAINQGEELGAIGAWSLCAIDRPAEALSFLESNRNFLSREALIGDVKALAARSNLSSDRAQQIAQIARKIERLQLSMSQGNGETGAIDEIQKEKLKLQDIIHPTSLASKVPSVADMAIMAPKGGVLLLPATSAAGTCVFLVTHDSTEETLRSILIPELTTEVLHDWRTRFLAFEASLTNPRRVDSDQSTEKDVSYSLLTALTDEIWDRFLRFALASASTLCGLGDQAPVTISAHGKLDGLPLHMASRIEGGRRFFLNTERVIQYTPGIAALELMYSRKKEPGERHLIGIINPTGDLLGAEEVEWPRIASLNWSSKRSWVGDDGAGIETIVNISADDCVTHLHFGTHSVFLSDAPESSGMILSDGDVLSVGAILGLEKLNNLEFVCMPTCQSGRSSSESGADEFVGLASAFIEAGAASLLTTFFPVPDERFSKLVPRLYELMLENDAASNIAVAVHLVTRERLNDGHDPENVLDCAALKASCA